MARSLSVALLGSVTLGKDLGKKGTTSDITLYNSTGEEGTVTYVEPTHYPDKFPPLLTAIAMGEVPLLVVETINRDLAEIVVSLDLAGKRNGLVALSPQVGEADFKRAFKGTVVENYPTAPLDPRLLKERLLALPAPAREEGGLLIPIDHAFPVKGVGTVILGLVRRGKVKLHDKLRLYPEEKSVEVKSIQVHDIDLPEADVGSRVGLALKGIEVEEISRGQVLAPTGSVRDGDLLELSDYAACKFFKGKAGEGDKVHVSVGLQVVPAKIATVDGARRTLQLDSRVAWVPGDRAFIVQLSGGGAGPRIAGGGVLA